MSATDSVTPSEIDHLQGRLRRLAEEKSYLQLIIRLIEKINPRQGLHDMVIQMLHSIVEAIGGTDIKIWYWIEDELCYASFLSGAQRGVRLEDPMALKVQATREFLEIRSEPEQALLRGGVLPGAWTWCFPLLVGDELVGIVKLENIHISGASLRSFLPIFFSHAALIISNEVRNLLRQQAQARLRLAASVFANSQEGIVITDAANRIIEVNDAFTRITGYTREEVLGKNPSLLGSGRQDAAFYAEMWRAIRETGSWRGEIWNRRKSGEIYAEMLSIDAVCDETGQIQHYVGAFSDISQIKAHQAELERIAHYDTLTSLPNRRLLADRLNQELSRARRTGRTLAICYLDLDGFKPVNDSFGHEAGDALLIEIGRRLQSIARAGDTVARLGGDEFVLLICDLVQEQECFHALERMLASIAKPFAIGQQEVSVSASIGVTLFPHDDADADTLLRHADQAMYQAKELGKGRFHIFDAEHDRLIRANRETLQRLEQALQRDEFVLFYQPKVDMTRGKVSGAEALIRWQHPTRGLLAPAEFLPLLTGTELEIALGEWVIETALAQLEAWLAQGLSLVVSVNISANHLLRPSFLPQLEAALRRYPAVPPQHLELEILESAAIDDLANASRTLAHCMALGVRFALDDFGTGYSSLTYFCKLPIGTLKIDQGFVRGMLDDPEDFGIIESVLGLAKAFNRPVIAEGVETIEHGAMLVMLGCAYGQGYGIARPMPASELADWVARWHGEEIWQTLADYALPPGDLILMVAARSRQRWQEALHAYVAHPDTQSPPPLLPTQCAFGRWYYGSALARYGEYAEFRALEQPHQALHAAAERISAALGAGDRRAAQEQLIEIDRLHEALSQQLDRLIARMRTNDAVPPAPTFDQ